MKETPVDDKIVEDQVVIEETPEEIKEVEETEKVEETVKSPEVESPEETTPPITTSEGKLANEIKNAFDRIKGSVKKNFVKRNSPYPINVGPLKNALQAEENFDEEDAYGLAKQIKDYIASHAACSMKNPENTNVDKVINDATVLLTEELNI